MTGLRIHGPARHYALPAKIHLTLPASAWFAYSYLGGA